MLEETARYAEILALLIAAAGVCIIIYSYASSHRSILITAAGALLVAGALVAPMILRGHPVTVIIAKAVDSKVEFVREDSYYGGTYTSDDGSMVKIKRERSWGPTATLLINDSDRLVTVKAYMYSALKFAGGRVLLSTYLLPGEYRVFPRRISFTGDDETGPPESISSISMDDSILFLAYSIKPYDPLIHGDEFTLNEEMEAPQRMPRISFKSLR